MPALVLNTDLRPASSSDASSASVASVASQQRSESPTSDRPPVSPITPTATGAQLLPLDRFDLDSRPRNEPPPPRPAPVPARVPVSAPPSAPASTRAPAPAPTPTPTAFRQQPPSIPVSESENPDAIALRSAISLLQIQREKSKRDLKALEDLKHAAVQDPEAFVRSLQAQRASAAGAHSDVLTPTLAGLTDDTSTPPRFPAIPQPQNIVRCPPIEWTKYHIVGEPLNKLHDEQKKWPGSSEPPKLANGHRAPPHAVAAPYSPFKDAVATKSKSKSPATAPSAKTKKTLS